MTLQLPRPTNTPTQAPVARVAESPNLRRRWHAWHVEQSQLLLEGQKYRKRSPVFSGSHAAGEMDRSLVLFDEAAAHPKAQPGTLFTFGGEEGSEKVLADPGRDARASIEDGDADSQARNIGRQTRFAQVQNQLAPIGHSFESIADQVGEYLPQFAGKSSHERHRFETLLHVDVALADFGRKYNQHAVYHA